MKNRNVPNKEQSELFHRYMVYWQQKLGLLDWRIEKHNKLVKGAMACVSFDQDARLVSYQLGDFGGEEINDVSLKTTALHEALHILLYDLINSHDDEGEEHKVINVLEKLLMEL
jgi:ABC-type iron transport system FetAB ATPase subunit